MEREQFIDPRVDLVSQIDRYDKEERVAELEKEIWTLKVQRAEASSVKPGKMTYMKMSNLFFRKDPKEVTKAVEKRLDLAEYERDGLVTELKREDEHAMAAQMDFEEGGEEEERMGFGFGGDDDFVDDELDDDDL